MDERIFTYINRERLLGTFEELVEVDSPSKGERQMADRVKSLFASLGYTVTEDDAGERLGGNAGNLFVTIPGEAASEPVFFGGHLDTVEPAKGKKAAVDCAGSITSAGATVLGADDLSAVAELIEVVRVLQEHAIPHRPLEIAFFVAEELYTLGSRVFDFSRVKAKEAYILDLSGEIGRAALRAPTFLYYKATVHGKASHAGFAPEAGISAIKAAADAIGSIPVGHVDADTTCAVGIIRGGLATNIVPEECTVEGEIRSYFDRKAEQTLEHIRASFERAAEKYGASVDFAVEKRAAAYHFTEASPIVSRFRRAAEAAGVKPLLVETFGGSDANTTAERGIPSLVIANGMNRIHTTEEYSSVGELCAACKLILALAAL